MTTTQLFPTALILLNIGAAVMYFPGSWRKVVYFAAAAALNFVVTF